MLIHLPGEETHEQKVNGNVAVAANPTVGPVLSCNTCWPGFYVYTRYWVVAWV